MLTNYEENLLSYFSRDWKNLMKINVLWEIFLKYVSVYKEL